MTDQQAQPLTGRAEAMIKRLRHPHEKWMDGMNRYRHVRADCTPCKVGQSEMADLLDALRLALERLQEPHIVVIQRDDATSWWISCSCSYMTKLKAPPDGGQAQAMEIATQHADKVKSAAKAAADA